MEVVPPELEMVTGNKAKPWCQWCRLVLQEVVQLVTRHNVQFTDLQAIRKYYENTKHIFLLNTS
jgi:hypothetical protein